MATVGFDIDGVCYDFRAVHAQFEVGRGNHHCALELAADHWDYFEGWGLSLDEWLTSYREGVDAGVILRDGDPFPGAVEATHALKTAGHTVHFITDRSIATDPTEPERATRYWLDRHGFAYDALTISRDKTSVPTDYFIEDRYENAVALDHSGSRSYLINRPWNTDRPFGRRVDTLDEFVSAVLLSEAVLSGTR